MAAWLMTERYPTKAELAKPGCPPTLICHGREDNVVPFCMAEELASIDSPVTPQLVALPQPCGHNDVFSPACLRTIWDSISVFLSKPDSYDLDFQASANLFDVPSTALAQRSAVARAFDAAGVAVAPESATAATVLDTGTASTPEPENPEPEPEVPDPHGTVISSEQRDINDADVDAVIIGAGPNGLFTGVQLALRCPSMRIVILEKYLTYQRKHVLKIEASSLDTGIDDEHLQQAHAPTGREKFQQRAR